MNKLFIFTNDSGPHYDALKSAYEIAKGRKHMSTVMPDLQFLQNNDIQVVVSNGLSPEYYRLLKRRNIVSITLDEDKYQRHSDIVINQHANHTEDPFADLDHSTPIIRKAHIIEVMDLAKEMEWDSDFFGFKIALISCLRLTSSIAHQVNAFTRQNNIRLMQYLCDCHDRTSVRTAENGNYRFVDIRLTLSKVLNADSPVQTDDTIFRKATARDVPVIRKISENFYSKSRYSFDNHFDKGKVRSFYQDWAEKGVYGRFDDECWCCCSGNTVTAFCTVAYDLPNHGHIRLFAVSPDHQGSGLGKRLLASVLNIFRSKGISRAFVVTQGRNYPAQNLYQSLGFRTYASQLWYHKWMNHKES